MSYALSFKNELESHHVLSNSLSPNTFGAEASTQGNVIGYPEIQGNPDISDIEVASHIYAGDFRLKSLAVKQIDGPAEVLRKIMGPERLE